MSTTSGKRISGRGPKGLGLLLFFAILASAGVKAQFQIPTLGTGTGSTGGRGGWGTTTSSRGAAGAMPNMNNPADSTTSSADTTVSGLQERKETPDSILRRKVYLFHYRPTTVWIDQLDNPVLSPTGVHYWDILDAPNGNYYIGKGALGHPHIALFPSTATLLKPSFMPDAFVGYRMNIADVDFYQTLSPYSSLTYGGSLAKDHLLRLQHTQNLMPGWNIAIDYRLLNPEGVYASSGAVDHLLNITTNYYSPDARWQVWGAFINQSITIDENGGISNDSIFIRHQQSNRAGIPVVMSGAGTRHRDRTAMARATYSIERQSDAYRHRDSLMLIQLPDSTTRLDTIVVVDTIPLHRPRTLNAGVLGLDLNYDRRKRVFSDSTLWREQWATLFWTNDAYPDYRWRNPLIITLGVQPRYVRAVVATDTMRSYAWVNPFARLRLRVGYLEARLEGSLMHLDGLPMNDGHRVEAAIEMPFGTSRKTLLHLDATTQSAPPELRLSYIYCGPTASVPNNIMTNKYSLRLQHEDLLDISINASHISNHTWIDTNLDVHQSSTPLWLLQAALSSRIQVGFLHLDMQQLLQHATNSRQMPLPLWASKNSLYGNVSFFHNLLTAQVGVDLRYHTPYHAPLYHPQTGLFLQQDDISVGGYLWFDAFVALQVKRANIYVKAGHINAIWETPATYFMLPHYPGQGFGVAWGMRWSFFE